MTMTSHLPQIFETTIIQEFVFLQMEFGLELTKESDYQFVAKSSNCHVVIDFDRNVVGCWIERLDIPLGDPYRGLSVEWIANSFGYRDDELRFLTYEESIIRQIKLHAKLLKDYCSEFLRGDFSGWKQVKEYVEKQIEIEDEKHNKESLKRPTSEIRQEAESAWLAKDYGKVISLFETMDEFLTPSERKKLLYSKKHASLK